MTELKKWITTALLTLLFVNTHEKFPHIVIKKGTTFCVVQI